MPLNRLPWLSDSWGFCSVSPTFRECGADLSLRAQFVSCLAFLCVFPGIRCGPSLCQRLALPSLLWRLFGCWCAPPRRGFGCWVSRDCGGLVAQLPGLRRGTPTLCECMQTNAEVSVIRPVFRVCRALPSLNFGSVLLEFLSSEP